MGWPLTVIVVLVTVWAVKAANKAEGKHHAAEPVAEAGPLEQVEEALEHPDSRRHS